LERPGFAGRSTGALTDRGEQMTDWERAFLRAALDLVTFQEPILAHFELGTGISAYDYWIRQRVGRRSADQQSPYREPWQYHFHGLEVEAIHTDGRHLRIELGPRGMTNVFTGWSVGVHVVESRPPWPAYSELKAFLRTSDRLPNHRRAHDLEAALLAQGVFARADSVLFALRERYTFRSRDGTTRIEIPPELEPATHEDIVLCERLVLTDRGRREAEAV
jgi:Domain of unknown function (DUF6896)